MREPLKYKRFCVCNNIINPKQKTARVYGHQKDVKVVLSILVFSKGKRAILTLEYTMNIHKINRENDMQIGRQNCCTSQTNLERAFVNVLIVFQSSMNNYYDSYNERNKVQQKQNSEKPHIWLYPILCSCNIFINQNLITLAFTQQQKTQSFLYSIVKKHLNIEENYECDEGLPLMSVGHGILDKDSIDEYKRKYKAFIVVMTDNQNYEENCMLEPFLKKLHKDFSNFQHTHNDDEIKIFRVDKAAVARMRTQEKEIFISAPSIYVVKDRKYFLYTGPLKHENFLSFLNKVINPYLHFEREPEIAQFLNADQELEEYTELYRQGFLPLGEDFAQYKRKYRVLVVLFEKQEVPSLMKKLGEAGERLANREDLRIALFTDRAKILNFLRQFKDKLNTTEKNLVILKNDLNQYKILELTKKQESIIDLEEWINKNSLDQVHEMDAPHVAKLVDMIKAPTLILFLDYSQQSVDIMQQLERMAEQYKNMITFITIKDSKLIDLRYDLGISSKDLPVVTIVTSKGVIYPFRYELGSLTPDSLQEYIKQFSTRKIRPLNTDQFQKSIDPHMARRLAKTKKIGSLNFTEIVEDPEKDVLVFFYSSEQDSQQWKRSTEVSSFFDTTAQRFKEHNYRTVVCGSYDVYQEGIPEHLMGIYIPSVVLFPAYHKDQYIFYKEKTHKTKDHMEFVEKNADIKFTLHSRAHLPGKIVRAGDPIHDSKRTDEL